MKCVATWSFTPFLESRGSGPWDFTHDMLACSVASIEAIYNIYGKPIIYTDTMGKEILSDLTDKATYINVYDGIYNNLSTNLWAYPKLLTYADQIDTYFHFDLDFIVKKDFGSKFNCDVLFQVLEPIGRMFDEKRNIHNIYNVSKVGHLYKLPEIFNKPNRDRISVANLGCLYMNNMKLNRIYTDTALKIVSDNIDVFNTQPPLHICVVEQQTLSLVMDDMPELTFNTIMSNEWGEYPFNDYFVHFIGPWKKKEYPGVIGLQDTHYGPLINDKVKYYAKMLDDIRAKNNVNKSKP
jgi:hypothetical protein